MESKRIKNTESITYSPIYPDGANNYSVLNGQSWITIDNTSGDITIDATGGISLGAYSSQVRYDIGTGDEAREINETLPIEVIDGEIGLNETDFWVCEANQDGKIWTLSFKNLPDEYDISIVGSDFVNVDHIGDSYVISIYEPEGPGTYTFGIKITDTITISCTMHIVDCNAYDTVSESELCQQNFGGGLPTNFGNVHLIWLNSLGGWESYNFIQMKTYQVVQKDSKQWINVSREVRHASRGKIYDAVDLSNDSVPKPHVDKVAGLRNAIQVFITTDITDPTKAKAVIIDEASFTSYSTTDTTYKLGCTIVYAKSKLIQNQ